MRATPQPDDESSDKPAILKAIELILASPEQIKREAQVLLEHFRGKYHGKRSDDQIRDLAVKKLISNYSYYCAFVGGATSLASVVPGLGTVIGMVGGTSADIALSMKFQIEMVMAIATIYGRDVTLQDENMICFVVAGLGAINEAAKEGGIAAGTKAFTKMAEQYLKGSILQAIKDIFKKLGVSFTRKAMVKAIPFGIGPIIGFSANKGLTWYVGSKAKDFYRVAPKE